MPFQVLPIEVEALRKLERTTRYTATRMNDPLARHEMLAMANVLGSVLDRADFANAMKAGRRTSV